MLFSIIDSAAGAVLVTSYLVGISAVSVALFFLFYFLASRCRMVLGGGIFPPVCSGLNPVCMAFFVRVAHCSG